MATATPKFAAHSIIFAMRKPFIAVLVLFCSASCLGWAQDLQIAVSSSQGAIVGQEVAIPLTASGGILPYTWHVVVGGLPPGLKLQKHQGKIAGVPTAPGTYEVTVAVEDSSIPKLQLRKELTIRVIEGLTVDWQDSPAAHGSKISGSAVVSNHTADDFDLTVVVVAVNQYGRATALGYQHFKLTGGDTKQIIPFGSTPGLGTYYVRVDAAAHREGKKHIFRASQQTPDSIKVTQF